MSNKPKQKAGFSPGPSEDAIRALHDKSWFWEILRLTDMGSARVDPHARHGIYGQIIGPAIAFGSHANSKAVRMLVDHAGERLINEIIVESADTLEGMFARIIEMKREFENGQHRNSRLVDAYFEFSDENDRPPTKRELREFVCSKPLEYPGFPDQDALTLWTPIFKATGFATLEEG